MPSVEPASKILVTGANGYLGAHVVKELIDRGFYVRGTVRNQQKGDFLKGLFGDKFEIAVVPDMEAPNAYDEAVVGVDGVAHIASIVKETGGHPDTVIKPAVAGTLGILKSVKDHAPSVKIVVIASSNAAIGGLTESDWNDPVLKIVEAQGTNAPGMVKYAASKVLAERAAWDFVRDQAGEISFDIVTLCPPWLWGPMIHEGTTAESINSSIHYLLQTVHPDHAATGDALINKVGGFVDVRDTAAAFGNVLLKPEASNQRYIVSAGSFTWQDVYDALNEAPAFNDIPLGIPGATKDAKLIGLSTQKYLDLLGSSHEAVFRPFKTTVRESLESALARGWVWKY